MNQSEPSTYALRVATPRDIAAISELQQASITRLQAGFLSPEQVKASHAGMGLDTQLIEDGTYFCVEHMKTGSLAGCGGWSFRATLYGGNHSGGRSDTRLDPETDRARIRAMYTSPEHTRRGIGRMVIEAGERAAKEAGFSACEMAATEAGKPFYLSCGYTVEEAFFDRGGAVPVPLYRMAKPL